MRFEPRFCDTHARVPQTYDSIVDVRSGARGQEPRCVSYVQYVVYFSMCVLQAVCCVIGIWCFEWLQACAYLYVCVWVAILTLLQNRWT